ncbi:MAG: AAA family ATPase [Pedococcus sp.]
MILWLNGTFGVGKTTTARLVVAGLEGFRAFDPEWVGYLLRENLKDHEFADFQELPSWRRLVPVVADEIARSTGQQLVVAQAVLDAGYWSELVGALRLLGHEVFHIVLDADPEVVRARIDADPEGAEIRKWRHDHVDGYVAARGWLADACDLLVDTGGRSADEVACEIVNTSTGLPLRARRP